MSMSRKFMITLTLWVLLSERAMSTCGPGALKCSNIGKTNERALICDPSMNYVLFDRTCIQQNISNCMITLDENHCRICKFGYYLTNERKCSKVPRKTASEIKNCNFYSSIDECKACNLNSYLRNNLCRPISKKVEDCALMGDYEKCEICDLKLPSSNQTYCTKPDQELFNKCLFLRHPLSCQTCFPGYTKDVNYFLTFIDQTSIHKNFFEKLGFWRHNYFDIIYNAPSCKFEYSISFCQELDYNNKCKVCLDGYVLSPDRTRCFIKPTPPTDPKERLPNCFKFKTENYEECEICYEKYFLKDDNTKCVKHTTVLTGCDVYSQTKEGECIFCSTSRYHQDTSNPNDQCKGRAAEILNCERFSRTSDKCLECAEGHIFHDEQKRCSLKIPNCNIHNILFRILQCTDCVDSHYLNEDSTQCFNANDSINGCQKYDKGPTCQICKQGFYLDVETKTCFFHDQFLNCQTLSVVTKNICDTCKEEGIRTTKTHTCTPVANSELLFDENCVNWNENQKCIECLTNYVLKTFKYTPDTAGAAEITTTKCQIERGCVKWDLAALSAKGGCTQCESGYYLYDFSCNKPDTTSCMYSFESAIPKHNFTYGTNLEGGFPCEICDQHRIFVVEQSQPEFRCIASTFFTSVQLVKNCLSFDKNTSGGYDCKKCRRNFILSGNACTQRPYVATQSYYVDMETMMKSPALDSQAVTITPKAGGTAENETWPLTTIPIGSCRVFGAGGKYCLQVYESIVQSASVTKLYFPFYNFFADIVYSAAYKIDTTKEYTGINADLKMNFSPLMVNFTSYKQYNNLEDVTSNRKSQEPYRWLDTVPISGRYLSSWKIQNAATFPIDAKFTDFLRLYSFKRADNSKGFITVCKKNVYGYKIPNVAASLAVDGVVFKHETNKLRIEINFGTAMGGTKPLEIMKTLFSQNKLPEMYPCDSSQVIPECVASTDNIDGLVRNAPYLSCYACNTDYAPRFTLFDYSNIHEKKNEYLNKVAMTDCVKVKNNTDAGNERIPEVANCYMFERVLHHVNSDIIHYCRNCKPGFYPKKIEEVPRCPTKCEQVQIDQNLAYELKCDDWYKCQPKCTVEVCDFENYKCNVTTNPFSCEAHTCCDDSKVTPSNPTPTKICGKELTRFQCRNKECHNNCLDTTDQDTLGLQCNAATARCEPKVCAGDCVCIKGECFSENCRNCLDEPTNNDSKKFCKQNGSSFVCVNYETCNPTTPARILSTWRILDELESQERELEESEMAEGYRTMSESLIRKLESSMEVIEPQVSQDTTSNNFTSRILADPAPVVITQCPLACQPNCKKSDRNTLTDDKVTCNFYDGTCTKIYDTVWWVCKCAEFEKKQVKITAPPNLFDAYTKKCIDLKTNAANCLCLGAPNHKNLELCDTHTALVDDYSFNTGKSCLNSATLKNNAISGTGDVKCGWTEYTDLKTTKDAAVILAAALAAALVSVKESITNTSTSVTAITADVASVDALAIKYPTNATITAAKALADAAKAQADKAKTDITGKDTEVENATTEAAGTAVKNAATAEENLAKAAEHAAQAALDTAQTAESALLVVVDVTAVDKIDTDNPGDANIATAKAVSDEAKTEIDKYVAEAKKQMDIAETEMKKPDVAKTLSKQVKTAAELEKALAAVAGATAASYAATTALADLVVKAKATAVETVLLTDATNDDLLAAKAVSDEAKTFAADAWTAAAAALAITKTKMTEPNKADTETNRDLVKAEMDKALAAQYGAEAADMAAKAKVLNDSTVTETAANETLSTNSGGNAEIDGSKLISDGANTLSGASYVTLKAKLVLAKEAMNTLVPADTLTQKTALETEYNKISAANSTTLAAHIYSKQINVYEEIKAFEANVNALKLANSTNLKVIRSKVFSDEAKAYSTTALTEAKAAMTAANTAMGTADATTASAELVKSKLAETKISSAKSLAAGGESAAKSAVSVVKADAVATVITTLDTTYVGDTNIDAVKVLSDDAKAKADASWTAIDALLVEAQTEMNKPDATTTEAKKVLILAEEAKTIVAQHAAEAAEFGGKVAEIIAKTRKMSADLVTLIGANSGITNLADVQTLADAAKAQSETSWADTATALTEAKTQLDANEKDLVIAERDKIEIKYNKAVQSGYGLEAAEAGLNLAKFEISGKEYVTKLEGLKVGGVWVNTHYGNIHTLAAATVTATTDGAFWTDMQTLLAETKTKMETGTVEETKTARDAVLAKLTAGDAIKYALEGVDMAIKNEEMIPNIEKIDTDLAAIVGQPTYDAKFDKVKVLSDTAKTKSLTFWAKTETPLTQLEVEMNKPDIALAKAQRDLIEAEYNEMLATDAASKAAETASKIIPLIDPVVVKATAIQTQITNNAGAEAYLNKAKALGDAAQVQVNKAWTDTDTQLTDLGTELAGTPINKTNVDAKKVLVDTEFKRAEAATEASLAAESAANQAIFYHSSVTGSTAAKAIIDTSPADADYLLVKALNDSVIAKGTESWGKIEAELTTGIDKVDDPDKTATEAAKTKILAEAALMESLKWAGQASQLGAEIAKNNKAVNDTITNCDTVLITNVNHVAVTAVKDFATKMQTSMNTAWDATKPLLVAAQAKMELAEVADTKAQHDLIETQHQGVTLSMYGAEGAAEAYKVAVLEIDNAKHVTDLTAAISADATNLRLPEIKKLADKVAESVATQWTETNTKMGILDTKITDGVEADAKTALDDLKTETVKSSLLQYGNESVAAAIKADAALVAVTALHKISTDLAAANVGDADVDALKNYTKHLLDSATASWTIIETKMTALIALMPSGDQAAGLALKNSIAEESTKAEKYPAGKTGAEEFKKLLDIKLVINGANKTVEDYLAKNPTNQPTKDCKTASDEAKALAVAKFATAKTNLTAIQTAVDAGNATGITDGVALLVAEENNYLTIQYGAQTAEAVVKVVDPGPSYQAIANTIGGYTAVDTDIQAVFVTTKANVEETITKLPDFTPVLAVLTEAVTQMKANEMLLTKAELDKVAGLDETTQVAMLTNFVTMSSNYAQMKLLEDGVAAVKSAATTLKDSYSPKDNDMKDMESKLKAMGDKVIAGPVEIGAQIEGFKTIAHTGAVVNASILNDYTEKSSADLNFTLAHDKGMDAHMEALLAIDFYLKTKVISDANAANDDIKTQKDAALAAKDAAIAAALVTHGKIKDISGTKKTDLPDSITLLSENTASLAIAKEEKGKAEAAHTQAVTLSGGRRILQSWNDPFRLYGEMQTIQSLWSGRILAPDVTFATPALYNADGGYIWTGHSSFDIAKAGCSFECNMKVNEMPTYVNPLDATKLSTCFESCSTADNLEQCTNNTCEKLCGTNSGLVLNCAANEECVNQKCVSKPCDPKCDDYYDTCDVAKNKCILKPRKPKINVINSCSKVDNCSANYYLDKCYQCQNFFSFDVAATGNTKDSQSVIPVLPTGVDPVCSASNIANAIMTSKSVNSEGTTIFKVEKCAPGNNIDYLNNICVSNVKNCKLFSQEGVCIGCDTPYETGTAQLVYGVFEKGFCKTWAEVGTGTPLDSIKDVHCRYYQYKFTNTANPVSLKEGASKCYQCDATHYFWNDGGTQKCAKKQGTDCKEYDNLTNLGVCKVCEPGFQKVGTACQVIENTVKKIPKCLKYDVALNCIECSAPYMLRLTGVGSGQVGYCFKPFEDTECETQDSTVFSSNGSIQCQKCLKSKGVFYYPRKLNTAINACLSFAHRNLCTKHDFDKSDSLALSNKFSCLECQSEYYIPTTVCVRRNNTPIKDCIKYFIKQDDCETYKSKTTVGVSTNEFDNEIESVQVLMLNPPDDLVAEKTVNFGGWIMGCEIYKNETACERCFAPKFINKFGFDYNTKCKKSVVSIPNCIAFNTDGETCDQCFPGYQLTANQCLQITVENCATYKSNNECGSCGEAYPYLDIDGNCTLDPRNMFCVVYINSNDTLNLQATKIFECDTCMEGFYPDDNSICMVVESEVRHCKYYAGDGLCKQCQSGYYLSFDGKNCFINPPIDPHCSEFRHFTECSVCEKGHYIDTKTAKCVACEAAKFPENCQYCDPSNHAICLVCSFGFQNTETGCIAVAGSAEFNSKDYVQPYDYFIKDINSAADSTTETKRRSS